METKQRYEIYLNHISALEYFKHRDTFEKYKQKVVEMLHFYNRFIFEDDLLEQLKNDEAVKSVSRDEPLTMQHIQIAIPDNFVYTGGHRKKNKEDKEHTKIWYKVWDEHCYLTPSDELYYDIFFIYKLRNLDLLEIDSFLDYQLEKWFGGDPRKFSRFLQIALRKNGKKLLEDEYIQTVNEWIQEKEKHSTVTESEPSTKTKGKLIRSRGDKKLKLNQEQTALLIHYLQSEEIIFKGEYLKNSSAGEAFSILTGYSADNLRQSLSKDDIHRIRNDKNLTELHNAIVKLEILIRKEIRAVGKSSQPS